MNQITPTSKIEIIPASAPFSEAQRSWLNGFFAARLNLCVPGGKETARMLKALHEELDKAPAASSPSVVPAVAVSTVIAEPGRSRDNPIAATFLSRRLLNKQGSEKETWHIDFDLS